MNFPKVSQIRLLKLIVHSVLLVTVLTLLSLIIQDVMNWLLQTNFPTVNGLASFFVMIWAFFAIQNKKYQKNG